MNKIRPIAIYLPQFHPIPENDKWWGKGFTEWTNVAKAKPLFEDHYQPHLPADLGFYDLRLEETRIEQAKLAKEHGIYGFCYYHYWFNGRRVLERPFKEVFESRKPDFPFMLCWANENWTRAWDGGDKDILLEQHYSEEDDRNHIRALIPYFKDDRYIKIDGRPVFAFYRSTLFPDIRNTIRVWREEAALVGIELYLCRYETFGTEGACYLEDGFDAAIEFQPHTFMFRKVLPSAPVKTLKDEVTVDTIKRSLQYRLNKLFAKSKQEIELAQAKIEPYEKLVQYGITQRAEVAHYKRYRCITPGWDNSPRKKRNFFVALGASPHQFGRWAQAVVNQFTPYSREENLLFINAWNEWAEGNHLEPCQKWGKAFLEQLAALFDNQTSNMPVGISKNNYILKDQ